MMPFDLELLGLDDAELDRLLAMELEPVDDADEVPDPPADPVSRPGDLWICGEHRVLCGDTTVLADVEKGRVVLEADGTIDAAKADASWERSSDPARRKAPAEKLRSVGEAAVGSVRETRGFPGRVGRTRRPDDKAGTAQPRHGCWFLY
jgi:hypothetical protein